MSSIAEKRCFNHGRREAVARCPSCGHYFCRECVIEHDGKVKCARCLSSSADPEKRDRLPAVVGRVIPPFFGVFILWLVFYYLGRALLFIPSSFHEGTFWK